KGRDLALADPNADALFAVLRRQRKCPRHLDHRLAERARMAAHTVALAGDAHHRVGDHLAGAGIGDVAATVGPHKLNTAALQLPNADAQMFQRRRTPQRHDRVVLDEEDDLFPRASDQACARLLLQRPNLAVRTPSEPFETHYSRSPRKSR